MLILRLLQLRKRFAIVEKAGDGAVSNFLLRIAELIERDWRDSRAPNQSILASGSLARTLDIPARCELRFFATAILHTESERT